MEAFDNDEMVEGQQFYSPRLVPRIAPLTGKKGKIRLTAGKKSTMGREPRTHKPRIKEPRPWG
jgi:hypothetical protein